MLFQQIHLGPVDKHQECPWNLFSLRRPEKSSKNLSSVTALYIVFSTPEGKTCNSERPFPDTLAVRAITQLSDRGRR